MTPQPAMAAACSPPPDCSLPTAAGPILRWDGTQFTCVALPSTLPASCNTGETLTWNGSAFTCAPTCSGSGGGFKASMCPYKGKPEVTCSNGGLTAFARVRDDGVTEGRLIVPPSASGGNVDTGWRPVQVKVYHKPISEPGQLHISTGSPSMQGYLEQYNGNGGGAIWGRLHVSQDGLVGWTDDGTGGYSCYGSWPTNTN